MRSMTCFTSPEDENLRIFSASRSPTQTVPSSVTAIEDGTTTAVVANTDGSEQPEAELQSSSQICLPLASPTYNLLPDGDMAIAPG